MNEKERIKMSLKVSGKTAYKVYDPDENIEFWTLIKPNKKEILKGKAIITKKWWYDNYLTPSDLKIFYEEQLAKERRSFKRKVNGEVSK